MGDRIAARREAADPTPPTPPEPWVDKPGTLVAAENEVLRFQLVEKLELLLCGGPETCTRSRCRRSRRCAELDSLEPMAEAARAALAREQAKWRPPPPPAPEAAKPRRGGRQRR